MHRICNPAMWVRFLLPALRGFKMKVELTVDLAKAIIEMDDIGFSEGLGPKSDVEYEAWRSLLEAAENVSGCEACSTRWSSRKG